MEMSGTYTKAVIFSNDLDKETTLQIQNLVNHPAFTEAVRIMPDVHSGKGSVIGFTMPLTQKVIPNVIGVDIGCGIYAVKISFNENNIDLQEIDLSIRRLIPTGFSIHHQQLITSREIEQLFNDAKYRARFFCHAYYKKFKKDIAKFQPVYNQEWISKKMDEINEQKNRFWCSFGTLGGGNHFIELAKDEKGCYWLLIHSGSRHFGQSICQYWQQKAFEMNSSTLFSRELTFLENRPAYEYLFDMIFAQQYAHWNRKVIQRILCEHFRWKKEQEIDSVHNYIDFRDLVIRKGAIRSYRGENMIVPLHMLFGSWIMEGKSNPEWNFSAPHGAGRMLSRTKAKKLLSLEKFKKQMQSIYSSSITPFTLDEAPDAYKKPEVIMKAIQPTAKILHHLSPILNFKDIGKK